MRRVGRSGVIRPDSLVDTLGLDDASCCGRCATDIERFVELAREGLLESLAGGPRGAHQPRPVLVGSEPRIHPT